MGQELKIQSVIQKFIYVKNLSTGHTFTKIECTWKFYPLNLGTVVLLKVQEDIGYFSQEFNHIQGHQSSKYEVFYRAVYHDEFLQT